MDYEMRQWQRIKQELFEQGLLYLIGIGIVLGSAVLYMARHAKYLCYLGVVIALVGFPFYPYLA